MSEALTALAAAVPLAAGWSLHSTFLRRRIETARRDPLTGLPTRDAFTECATRILAGGPSAVYLIDLDRFKEINDAHGHAAGDAVIRATGGRLDAWARFNEGLAGRFGGDEFAAVAPARSLPELHWTLRELTRSLTGPVDVDGHQLAVGASIGAIRATTATGAEGLSVLLRAADEAMYGAKQTGGGWQIATDPTPACGTANGRRDGRPGTTHTRTEDLA
ncbi:GGDEF domain-containing protein [Streptomyces sp. NPDC088124]|uniref:GGDEF domain-containing protein n=1 Tax=Streptomyces sp. NPDC088124 TaxID=3154654 RepID=UPI00344662A2